jgi:hypothetical protein
MCAAKTDDRIRVHLEAPDGRTLCGFLAQYVIDRNVATGWPDCNECIKATDAEKPMWLQT